MTAVGYEKVENLGRKKKYWQQKKKWTRNRNLPKALVEKMLMLISRKATLSSSAYRQIAKNNC